MRWSAGDAGAFDTLLEGVYQRLSRIAASYLRSEPEDLTLETCDLVQEALLRLVDQRRVSWRGRAHFYSVAAQAMRRILVDHARRRLSSKRGGDRIVLRLDHGVEVRIRSAPELVALDDALASLSRFDPELGRVVELRYFAGLTIDEIGSLLETSARTVRRRWRTARAWLYRQLVEPPAGLDA